MKQAYLILCVFFLASMSGCLDGRENNQEFNFEVKTNLQNGTIIETYVDGERESIQECHFHFEFSSESDSSRISTYGINNSDSEITINAKKDSTINLTISHHGLYRILAFAIDDQGYRVEKSITIIVELQMEWREEGTSEPKPMPFKSFNTGSQSHPSSTLITSFVKNPSITDDFTGGRPVEITWNIADELNEICQSHSDEVGDGETVEWKTIYFNTIGTHELQVNYDEGQDLIDIEHILHIQYQTPETS